MKAHTLAPKLNHHILRLALPNILTNITVPLLGMVDLALSGHLAQASAIGGVAIATTILHLIYWNFSFLRMGSTGLTAQAHGADDKVAMGSTLGQSVLLAILFGGVVVLLQNPLLALLTQLLNPSPQLLVHATTYYQIVIWGAPALIATYALNGWLIGMQNTWWPMVVSIVTNVTNIALSSALVLLQGWQVEGLATGTVVAQWLGALLLVAGAWWLFIRTKKVILPRRWQHLTHGLKRYFGINLHIYLRTMLLASVTLFFTYVGTKEGVLALSANALLLQFFTFFSYFIDGFAYAAEAIVGHFYGRKQREELVASVRKLFQWGGMLALLVTLLYIIGAEPFLHLLTDKPEVIAQARQHLVWVWLLPLAGFAAFLYDGIYVGVTATGQMLQSMALAVLLFFLIFYLNPLQFASPISALWFAFVMYLVARGAFQYLLARKLEGIGRPFTHSYYLSVGTTRLHSEGAIKALLNKEWQNIRLSPFYITPDATGKSPKQYLNCVALLQSTLTAEELSVRAKELEKEAGRGTEPSDEVALDIDVVLQGTKQLRPHDFQQAYFQRGYVHFTS